SQSAQNPHSGRCRWEQQIPTASVETATPRKISGPLGFGSSRLPLSNRHFEVEPRGASFVWANQHQLGRQTFTHLRNGFGLPSWNRYRNWSAGKSVSHR